MMHNEWYHHIPSYNDALNDELLFPPSLLPSDSSSHTILNTLQFSNVHPSLDASKSHLQFIAHSIDAKNLIIVAYSSYSEKVAWLKKFERKLPGQVRKRNGFKLFSCQCGQYLIRNTLPCVHTQLRERKSHSETCHSHQVNSTALSLLEKFRFPNAPAPTNPWWWWSTSLPVAWRWMSVCRLSMCLATEHILAVKHHSDCHCTQSVCDWQT